MDVTLRKFQLEDVPLKVRWVNSKNNNQFLHYDIPITEENTYTWFQSLKGKNNRADFTILCDDVPVGVIGLLNIDPVNQKAEMYILLGEDLYKGRGIARKAISNLLDHCTTKLKLNKIYLYTEEKNLRAQILFERCGFVKEGFLREDLIYRGRKINRLLYGLLLGERKGGNGSND